ncbi:MAG: HEAT repeat domain-containing protein [Bacteriovoracia bacterium]
MKKFPTFKAFLCSSLTAIAGLALSHAARATINPISDAEDKRDPKAGALIHAVSSTSATERARAALALGRILKPEGIDPLFTLLSDKRSDVHVGAIFSLGQLGWQPEFNAGRDGEILERLKPSLRDPAATIRAAATEAVGKLALERTPEIVTPLLGDRSPEVRAEAVMALMRARLIAKLRALPPPADLPESVITHLGQMASDPDARVRRNVAYFFARFKDLRGEPLLLKLAKTVGKPGAESRDDEALRMFIAQALGKSGRAENAATREALEKLARDARYPVRLAAVGALTTLHAKAAWPKGLVIRLVHDSSKHVRAATAAYLGESPHAEAEAWLAELRTDTSIQVQAAAMKALALRKREQALEIIQAAARSPHWPVRIAALEASDGMKGQETFALSLRKDADVRVRAQALGTLAKLETETAYDAIVAALGSTELAERGSAVDALAERKESDVAENAWKCYQACLQDQALAATPTKWNEVKENLTDLIAKTPGDTTTGYLKKIAQDPHAMAAIKALRALKERGVNDLPEPPTPQLTYSPYRDLVFKRNPIVRMKTTRGLIRMEVFASQDGQGAPIHAANFIGQVKAKLYDGLAWHRVVPNFVIQGGDPDGTGWGDAGYSVRAEINHRRFRRGTLAMPRSAGFDTGGVQIFIDHVPTPHLDGQYTVFGQVIDGAAVIDEIEMGDRILQATVE